jgi:hypothetical protein
MPFSLCPVPLRKNIFDIPYNPLFVATSKDVLQHWNKINLTLAVLTPRKVDNGHCIRFNNEYYKLIDGNGYPVYYRRGTSGMVLKAFDGQMFFCMDEKVYALEVIPKHERVSKNFDVLPVKDKPKKRYIPPMSHPWKQASFEQYMKKQAHRKEKAS